MKMNRVSGFNVIGVAIVLLLVSCSRAPKNNPIVEFVCDLGVVFLNYADMLASGPDEDGRLVFYLREPALFQIISDEMEFSALHLYLPEDGDRVEIHIDGDILYANGIARSIFVDPDKPRNFASWCESADAAALKSLRIVSFEDESAGAFETNQVEQIMAVNPHVVGCWDTALKKPGKEGTAELAPLIIFTDAVTTNAPFMQEFLESMDFSETVILMADGIDSATLQLLKEKGMPKLRLLQINDSEGANELMDALPRVKAVNITKKTAKPFNLDSLTDLEELHLSPEKSSPCDFGRLARPEKLRALTINVTTNVTGLEKLVNLEYLNPGKTEWPDIELTRLLANHPDLVFLDLSLAKIESLKPLRNLLKLEVVALGDFITEGEPDFSPLGDLPNLRYVALNGDLHESGAAAAIREVCPQTVIYFHDKFCLGSGWLLMFPLLLVATLLVKRMRTKAHRRA